MSRFRWIASVLGLAAIAAVAAFAVRAQQPASSSRNSRETTSTVNRRDFTRTLRLSGSVEAVEATTISTPRLAGQNNNSLVITQLIRPGTMVRQGDLIVEFDR